MSTPTSTLSSGEILFTEGSAAKSLFFVKIGRVSIRKAVKDGHIEIAQIGPNQIVGEFGFFDKQNRSADAIALTYCELVEIPYSALNPIFDPAPDYLKKIMAGLAHRLREADETICELKSRLGEKQVSLRKTENSSDEESDSETKKILRMTED